MSEKHPADGLYYITRRMLSMTALHAAALYANVPAEKPTPLTLELIRKMGNRGGLMTFACSLVDTGRIDETTFFNFKREWHKGTPGGYTEARAFMDMLHARAKHEGLVS